jgi:hypothetical protein
MNKKCWSFLLIVLVLLIALPATAGPLSEPVAASPPTSEELAGQLQQTFNPGDDGHVVRTWGRYHVTGDNHDGEGLLVQSTADHFRRSYLQFDLASLQGVGISQATLRLFKTGGPAQATPLIGHLIEEDWDEATLGITDTTTPWLWEGLAIFSQTVGVANGVWIEVSMTTAVNRAIHGDSVPASVLNLGLSTDALDYTWGATALTFADSESANPPELVITYNVDSPFAEAGPDQEFDDWTFGDTIQLDGSASSDPNQSANTLFYSWRFLHVPGDSSLTYEDITPNDGFGLSGADQPTFIPDAYGTYILWLAVGDNTGRWNSDRVTVELMQPLPDHPRVWLTAARLNDLRQRAGGGEAAWTRLEAVLNAHIGDGYQDLYAPNNWMIQYAFGYQVLLQSDPSQANTYADKAIELAQYVLDNDPDISADSWLYFGDNAAGLAIVYDWCYDRLSAQQRSDLIAKMNEWVAEAFAMPNPVAYYAVEHRPDNNRYYAHAYGRALVGLATLGENEPLAQQYVDAVVDQSRYEILPFRLRYGVGGGWSEGWNYLEGALSHMFMLTDAYRTVYGVNGYRETTFPESVIEFVIHATLPDLKHGTPEGDMWETQAMVVDLHRLVMLLLVNEYEGESVAEYGQYWLNHTITLPDAHTTPGEMYDEHNYVYDFLWDDPSRTERAFDSLGSNYVAAGTGLGFTRSDWSEDATWVSFTCGGSPTDHLQQGHGHVNLWRGEWLSADPNYGATVYGYNHEAWLHSVVTVNEQDVITGTNQAAYTAGRVNRREGNSFYAYARGDVTPVMEYFDWNSGQYVRVADHYTRELLHFSPDTLVLFDRVRATDAAYFKRWQLNVPTAPTIVGDLVTAMGVGGQAKLFVRSLLPAGAAISSVQLSDINDWAGLQGYQVRVRPASQQVDDLFLHVLYATDAATPAMPSTSQVVPTSGDMVGTHVAETPYNYLALFSSDPLAAPPSDPIIYTYTPTTETLHVLAGMPASTGYTVTVQLSGSDQTVTVAEGEGLVSSSQGVLAFLVTSDGQVYPTFYYTYLPLVAKGAD